MRSHGNKRSKKELELATHCRTNSSMNYVISKHKRQATALLYLLSSRSYCVITAESAQPNFLECDLTFSNFVGGIWERDYISLILSIPSPISLSPLSLLSLLSLLFHTVCSLHSSSRVASGPVARCHHQPCREHNCTSEY